MSDKPEKIWYRICPADCGADSCDIIEDKQRTDDSTEYIRADLAKPSELQKQLDEARESLARVKEKLSYATDKIIDGGLAKPSECAEGNKDCMCCPEHKDNWRNKKGDGRER